MVECMGKHGFREKFTEPTPVSFSMFRELTVNWAGRLQRASVLSLRSSDYVRIKNTLHVLSRLIRVSKPSGGACLSAAGKAGALPCCLHRTWPRLQSFVGQVFPKTETQAIQLRSAAGEIVKAGKEGRETREDILNRATNYHAIMSAELKRKGR